MVGVGKFKILVVDDEPAKRELLAFMFRHEGYEVHEAEDGLAGLTAAETLCPDLIVTDVMMPRMDGYEMIRRLRSDPRTRFVPVIIQTAARSESLDTRRGAEAGAVGYLTDPTDLDLLIARARTLLEFKGYLNSLEEELRQQAEERELSLQRKVEAGAFDVFLCHNNKDKGAVKEIALKLRARGILPWLDEWHLRPGFPWQDALERQITQIKAAAVFVGENGIGPWQKEELNAFLREFVARGCPVIPVLLPSAPEKPELPIFLRGMTWVDFRTREPDPTSRLIWGIGDEES